MLTIYTSNAHDPGLAGLVLAMGFNLQRDVRLLPLEALPAPKPKQGAPVGQEGGPGRG